MRKYRILKRLLSNFFLVHLKNAQSTSKYFGEISIPTLFAIYTKGKKRSEVLSKISGKNLSFLYSIFWFQKISKEFLRAATLYKVYCLRLSSGYPNRFLATIENSNEKLLSSSCGTFICNCENLQNLSRWLHISFIEAIFGYFDP